MAYSREQNIKQAKEVHGNKYTYSLLPSNPKRYDEVSIICNTCGLTFQTTLYSHIKNKTNCGYCTGNITRPNKWYKKNLPNYIEVPDEREYGCCTVFIAKCLKHNREFSTTNEKLNRGVINCKDCKEEKRIKSYALGKDEWLKQLEVTHQSKYEYLNIDTYETIISSTVLKIKCKECKNIFEQTAHNHIYNGQGCKHCNKGKAESELLQFIKTHYKGEVQTNVRNIIPPQELDIYLPELKLAIEYNGLYWHSDITKDRKYHLDKTIYCQEKGIQLIHIWEHNWIKSKKAVENYLHSKLNNCLPIYARHTKVRVVSNTIAKQFLNKYHIQGKDNSKVYIGLYLDKELLSVMSFSKPRFDKKTEWELVRYCTKYQTNIIGGASKLLKYFEKHYKPDSIVSYADYSRSTGRVYNQLGFILQHRSPPNYIYFNRGLQTYTRVQVQKHKLEKIFKDVDMSLTEREIMQVKGFNRLYDCGNLVYLKKYKKGM